MAAFNTALVEAGARHDIAILAGESAFGLLSLGGGMRALPSSNGVRVIYELQFRDPDGALIGTIGGEDNAGVFAGADPWQAVTPSVLDRVARRTADELARRLAEMGYAARVASLIAPPPDLFAKAGEGAERQIDFETVHGPGLAALGTFGLEEADKVVAHEDFLPAVASVAPLPGEGMLPTVAVSDEGLAPAPSGEDEPQLPQRTVTAAAGNVKDGTAVQARSDPVKQAIRAVAVVPVKGSPGGGDAELTTVVRKVLSEAGWPVVSKPQHDALTVEGRVKLSKKDAETETVSIRWLVKTPDGKLLGDVKQSNDLPKGALDQGWGPAARAVAEAAATGIFDVVKNYR
ncbi:MAG: hypothetical protein ACKOED_13970 [Aestuariivirga sp.]|uniref:hypothetical protein n=1 Tax=Aestuariivirga sp. TaxID=2650926 RepID=UPI0038CF431F